MNTTLQISYKDEIKTYECNLEDTVINTKKNIIKLFNLDCKYIDIYFKLERPIRYMGKFNLDNGLFLRTFDNYKLNKWHLENKLLKCDIFEINDYEFETFKPIVKKSNQTNYRPPSKSIKSGEDINQKINYNLNSSDDFPTF